MNIRRLTLMSLMVLVCFGMLAVPAKKGLRTFTQPDGSTIHLQLIGDEHFHTYATKNGLAAERGEDGFFYLRSAEGRSDIKINAINANLNADLSKFSVRQVIKTNNNLINSRKARKAATVNKHKRQVPCIGSPRIPVLLVQYQDYKFKDPDPKATFTSFFTQGKNSAYQYFTDQSNGKYTPKFDVYGPFTLPKNRAYYGENDFYGYDKYTCTMVAQGCMGLDSEINYSQYDNDGDGECDVVIILYAGDGEASSYDDDAENAIWPCQWQLSAEGSDYGKALKLDNTTVDKFAVFNELNGLDLSKIDGIGTFCHEFSHCIDLPDFYDTEYGPHFGMAHWSIMDYGSYNNDGYTPLGYSAYEKEFMGWIDIEEAKENTFYTLPALNQKNIDTDKAVRITNNADPNEYYILENRKKQGWDEYLPTEGLFIYHVTYDENIWINNTVNDEDMQRMVPIPADNSLKIDRESYMGQVYYSINEADLIGDLWPYKGNNALTDTSAPAAKVNTGKLMGKPITEITKNNDGTISFWTMKGMAQSLDIPSSISHQVLSSSSAKIAWQPLAEDVTYTLEIREHKDVEDYLIASYNYDEMESWASSGYTIVEENEGGIRLGSSKQLGAITSPKFKSGKEGFVTVNISSKYYNNDESDIKVSLLNSNGSIIESFTYSLTSYYNDQIHTFKTAPDSEVAIKIETIQNKKRAYISSINIFNCEDISSLELQMAAENDDIRTYNGITTNSFTLTDLNENGKYDYRLKAVPNEGSEFSESKWSPYYLLDLAMTPVVSIETIGSPEDVEYFTLQGLKLNSTPMEKGIYIRCTNGKTQKIIIK